MMDIIIGWFQSLRGAVRAISNEELPPMEDGPAGRTRSTLGIENNTLEHESNENNADYPEDLMCGICQDLYLNPDLASIRNWETEEKQWIVLLSPFRILQNN